MKAVILVGGEGTRLRPLTYNVPKPMVPIINRPFLQHMLGYLKSHDIDEVILALCYLPDSIENYFGDGSKYGVKLRYVIEEMPLGTAGAVKNVSEHIDDTFFVFNGDVFSSIDLSAMLESHRRKGASATIALTEVDNPTIYGVVETDADNRVKQFIEKPAWDAVTTNMINAGVYVLEPDVLQYIPVNQFYMFEHGLFPLLLERDDVLCAYGSSEYWIDIGTPEKYMKLNFDFFADNIGASPPGTEISDGVWAEEGCVIRPGSVIDGPVAIGRDCIIEAGARISGPVVIGADCLIGSGSCIERSIIWDKVQIGRQSIIQQSLIANEVNINAHCQITAGCILGQGATIENSSKLAPGTKAMPGKTLPCSDSIRS